MSSRSIPKSWIVDQPVRAKFPSILCATYPAPHVLRIRPDSVPVGDNDNRPEACLHYPFCSGHMHPPVAFARTGPDRDGKRSVSRDTRRLAPPRSQCAILLPRISHLLAL